MCGKKFPAYKQQKYCTEKCRLENYKSVYTKNGKMKRESASLIEVARKAREAGMKYGQYVAKMERNVEHG